MPKAAPSIHSTRKRNVISTEGRNLYTSEPILYQIWHVPSSVAPSFRAKPGHFERGSVIPAKSCPFEHSPCPFEHSPVIRTQPCHFERSEKSSSSPVPMARGDHPIRYRFGTIF